MECKLGNINVHYYTYGEGYPIIMLHGYYADSRLMSGCMEPCFQGLSGWQRIYLDLPGMGATKAEEWIKTSDDMLDVVLRFIDKVIPGRNFLMVGESYGGYLARGVIAKRSALIDGLLLICPVVVADRTKRNTPEPAVIVEDEKLMSTLNTYESVKFRSMAVVQSERTWNRFKEEVLSGMLVADNPFLSKLRKSAGYTFSFDVDNLEIPFLKPVTIITGRQDSIVGYRDAWRIIEKFPRGSFIVLDRAGHNLQIEQDELLSCLVNEWLKRVVESIK